MWGWKMDETGTRLFLKTAEIAENKCSQVFTYSKGKAIPLQALTGPEGFRRLRLPDFKTIGT